MGIEISLLHTDFSALHIRVFAFSSEGRTGRKGDQISVTDITDIKDCLFSVFRWACCDTLERQDSHLPTRDDDRSFTYINERWCITIQHMQDRRMGWIGRYVRLHFGGS